MAEGTAVNTEENGHGTHVTSLIANAARSDDQQYLGVAPNVRLVSVKAFGSGGQGTYLDVIRGIDWVVQHKDSHDIRVLNCSFSAAPRSHYWEDPLNQAIMAAWQAGIVVVASAGNTGPDPMTIGVPANCPYVIAVGGVSDNFTPDDGSDDFLSSFSSTGPTHEGFIKPDVVAPSGHVWGLMPTFARIAQDHPEFQRDGDFFTMSGTSQSAAIVSGVVALMLEAAPALTPDDVKCRLLATAFGVEHYGGRAHQNPDGTFYVEGLEGLEWDGGYAWTDAYIWNDAFIWNDAYIWNDTLTEPMAINVWAPQE